MSNGDGPLLSAVANRRPLADEQHQHLGPNQFADSFITPTYHIDTRVWGFVRLP